MDKVIIGSIIKQLNKSKIHGILNLKDIYVLNIIRNIKLKQNNIICDETSVNLDKLMRDIINKNVNICSYRNSSNSNFISNSFLNNVNGTNNLYEIWISQGNEGSILDFLNLILLNDNVNLKENNW